jgi:hypothetical protein
VSGGDSADDGSNDEVWSASLGGVCGIPAAPASPDGGEGVRGRSPLSE